MATMESTNQIDDYNKKQKLLTWFSYTGRATRLEMFIKGVIWIISWLCILAIVGGEELLDFYYNRSFVIPAIFSMDDFFNEFILACLLHLPIELEWRLTQCRRLHDQNKSGLLSFLFFVTGNIPLISPISYVVEWVFTLILDGTFGPNKYGPDPSGRDIKNKLSRNTPIRTMTIDEKLAQLDKMYKKRIISESLYKKRRNAILGIQQANKEKLTSISEEKIGNEEKRLITLKTLKENNLITEEEYNKKRQDILANL